MILVDTNIILRFILNDDLSLSPKARIIFEKITKGEIKTFISLLVTSEVIFTLERSYKIPKAEIIKSLTHIFKLANLIVEKQELVEQAFVYYLDQNISFQDAYQVALMQKKKIKQIYSFDSDFDKFPQIKRLEK